MMNDKLKLDLNRNLLGITFTMFVLILTLELRLLTESILIPLQLTIAIPLFLSSSFARVTKNNSRKKEIWNSYAFITFIIGYSFLINVIGLLLSNALNPMLGLIFFLINILTAIIYSTLKFVEEESIIKTRIMKDCLFILILILGGILPSLGYY